jgi:hypothetical protein
LIFVLKKKWWMAVKTRGKSNFKASENPPSQHLAHPVHKSKQPVAGQRFFSRLKDVPFSTRNALE